MEINKNKVVIIGCGNVGMSYAYALLNQRTYVNELVLVDLNKDRTIGEAMDLNHCLAFSPSKMSIKVGEYSDAKDADIVMIAAGVNQKEGETRLELLKRNEAIFKSIIDEVMKSGFNGIFLIATNPVDIMTYITQKYSKLPYNRVIGSGTCLDSARLRYMIGDKLGIDPSSVHGYVIGEHGDSEFIPWSSVNVGQQNINDFLNIDDMTQIEKDVREAAYEIINKKGATYYGIGMCLVRITNAILGDENRVIVVSSYDEEKDVYIGLPCAIGAMGVTRKIKFNLTNLELEKFNNSIKILRENIEGLEQ